MEAIVRNGVALAKSCSSVALVGRWRANPTMTPAAINPLSTGWDLSLAGARKARAASAVNQGQGDHAS